MNERLAKLGIGFLAVAAIGIPISFVASAYAQNPPAAGPGGGGFSGQGGSGRGPQVGRPMGFGGGGGGAIAADGGSVFVLQGNRVFRLDRMSLKVVAEGELPGPKFQPGTVGPGFGGGGNPGQGGGGGTTSK